MDSDDIRIKVFENDEKSLKELGELLSNDSSRKIIRALIEQEMYTNQLAAKLDLRPNLVVHHLKKLEQLGLVQVSYKKLTKKGNEHRFFKMAPGIFVLPNHSKEEIEEKGILKNFFKTGIKLSIVAIIGIVTWLGTTINSNKILVTRGNSSIDSTVLSNSLEQIVNYLQFYSNSIIITSIVVCCTIFLIWFLKKEKKIRGLSH